jgi:hypothetical protein
MNDYYYVSKWNYDLDDAKIREQFENENTEESKRIRKITRTAVRFPRTCGPGKSPGRSGDYNFSVVSAPAPAIPAPYIAIVHGDIDRITAPPFTPSEVTDLLSAAENAWLRNTDHLAHANAASTIERFECTDLMSTQTPLAHTRQCPLMSTQMAPK